MEDSKSKKPHDEFSSKKSNNEIKDIKKSEQKSLPNIKKEFNQNKDLKIINDNNIDKGKDENLTVKSNVELEKSKDNFNEVSEETINEKVNGDNKLFVSEINIDKSSQIIDKDKTKITEEKSIAEVTKEKLLENNKKDLVTKSNLDLDKSKNNIKQIPTTTPVKAKTKPAKEPPIEKKPFLEFVNDFLIPEIKNQFKLKGKEVNKINIQKTNRPIADDICWVIYCEIEDTCNFWLSFEKDDITSLKSFSLCKNYEKPSIIESFLIDEKKITLKLIISRILQRLNGQKLIGAN